MHSKNPGIEVTCKIYTGEVCWSSPSNQQIHLLLAMCDSSSIGQADHSPIMPPQLPPPELFVLSHQLSVLTCFAFFWSRKLFCTLPRTSHRHLTSVCLSHSDSASLPNPQSFVCCLTVCTPYTARLDDRNVLPISYCYSFLHLRLHDQLEGIISYISINDHGCTL